MLKRATVRSWTLVAVLLASPNAALALPVYSFTFSQSFQSGATLTGSFSGSDLDGDGWLNSFLGEITAYSIAYSSLGSTSAVGPFTHAFTDLVGLVHRLGSPLVGDALGDDLTFPFEGISSGPTPPVPGFSPYAYRTGFGPTGVSPQPFGFVEDNNFPGPPIDHVSTHVLITGVTVVSVAEPATLTVLGLGLLGVVAASRRRRRPQPPALRAADARARRERHVR